MNIRFYNARILTMEPGCPVFAGEVWVSGDRILYVGAGGADDFFRGEKRTDCIVWDEEIDCGENLLMPGFKDAHTHSGMTFLRSFADDVPLDVWLNEKIFPMEAKLSGEDIRTFVKLAVLEYLTSGITAVFDMYIDPEATAMSCMEMGMRCVLVSGLNNFTSSVQKVEEEYDRWNHASPLISYIPGFHAEYTCDRKLLEQLSALVHKLHAPVYAHLSETKKEVEECRGRYGMNPPVFLDSLGLFDYGGGGYHCVHMDEDDLDVFTKRGLYAVTNPASNAKLASGIAPIDTFLKRKIPVAVGTDGAASNNCLDMFREMFLVSGLAKLRESDAACVDAMEILKMATVNGAKAMGLHDADVLAEGKLADMILIDLKTPNMRPIHNIGKNLVYSGSKQNVKMTMIGGRILYRDQKFMTGEDAADIYREVDEAVSRLTK